MTNLKRLLVMSACGLALAQAQATVLDNFNRPDGALGGNWTIQNGNMVIINNQAAGDPAAGWSFNLATYNGVSSDTVFADVYCVGTTLDYAALILGYASPDENAFIKVQGQDGGGMFDHAAFYYGNNGGGSFFTLSQPFSSAHMIASLVGDAATLTLDTDFDGVPEQTYTWNYGGNAFGTGIGMAGFLGGSARLDNYGIPGGQQVPEVTTTISLLFGSVFALGLMARKRRS